MEPERVDPNNLPIDAVMPASPPVPAQAITPDSTGPESQTSESGNGSDRQASISGTARQDQINRERATVPSACVQCRSKHLKCDGLSPCTRCSSNILECLYVRSRRGFKGPRKNANQMKTPPIPGIVERCPIVGSGVSTGTSPSAASGLITPPDNRPKATPRSYDMPLFDIGQELVSFDPKAPPSTQDFRERCLEAYFYHFSPAHPFVLPRNDFYAVRQDQSTSALEASMCYVGSFYVPQAPTALLGAEAETAIYNASYPKNGFRVQAMLVLAIGLDGYTFQEKALEILQDAQDLAVEIGMNARGFALANSNGSATLEESWRRTWWELYLVDGMIAGVHQQSTFRMKDMTADVDLPCEEREYINGQIPKPHSLHDFDDDSFDERNLVYSSFAYRIAAIRNLGRILSARQIMTPDEPTIDRLDAHLVTWRLHMPDTKKDFINSEGQLDEMLFQAYMITEATTVLLHRELSELDSSIAKRVNSCAPHKAITPGHSYNIHAAKTIQAAQNISKLIQLPVPLVKHTHFFTCVVTLASIVHLSCWGVLMPLVQDEDLKQQLRLATGALKTLMQVWPTAERVFGQVKSVATEIYTAKKQAVEAGYWNLSNDEIVQSMMEDQGVMEELQLLV